MSGSIKIKNAEICWKIENLFHLLRQEKRARSSSDISLNNKTWYFLLHNFGRDKNFHIFIYSSQKSLLEDGECFKFKIRKIDGSSYINENANEYLSRVDARGYINPTPLTNLLDIEKSLSQDGSLSIFISLVTDTSLNPNQQADVLDMDTHKVLVPSRDVASQTISLEAFQKLSKDFQQFLASGRHTDVKIKVGEKEFQAHKLMLAARSPVLDSMFSQQMLENNTGVVNISDCDANAFESFLAFLYTGQLDHIPSNNIVGLYDIADKYDLPDLMKECVKRLIIELSVDSVCDALRVAAMHEEKELMRTATSFFVENAEEILYNPNWKSFLIDHPELGNELFKTYICKAKETKIGKHV